VDSLHHGAPIFTSSAEKYEGGMLAFPPLYGLGASVELMLELGPQNIERRVRELADLTRCRLRAAGGQLLCDSAPHYDAPIVAARFPGIDAAVLAKRLREERIVVSARHGNLRVSVHFYNSEQDLERLAAGLIAVL
jgi:selenocysteine lyase/cysteine desulfurase